MVQVYAALDACGITLLELRFINVFKWMKTDVAKRDTLTHTSYADNLFLFPLLVRMLTAVRADPTACVVAKNTNVNAKGESEANSHERKEGRSGEPGDSRSFTYLNPRDCTLTLLAETGWSIFQQDKCPVSQHCTNVGKIRGNSNKQPERGRR